MNAPVEVTREAPRSQLAPIDTSVPVPPSVKRAAAAAEALHAAAYQTPAPVVENSPQADPLVVENNPQADPSVQSNAAPVTPPVAPAPLENVTEQQWEHRYNSMKGRYDQAMRNNGMLQEQLQEMSNEVMQWQNRAANPSAPVNTELLTPEERAEYGVDLIDVTKRAAREALTPEIETMRGEMNTLKQTIQRNNIAAMWASLDAQLPEWRTINRSDKFKAWVSLPDIYSGQVRHGLLNQAFQAADVPRVIGFFNGFIRDEAIATGTSEQPVPQPAAGDPPPAPRQAAVPLVNLAAPGRAKPATGGNANAPVEKPVFTRADVAKFYRDVRTGYYTGRVAEKNAREAEIFSAQNDGRIR